MIDKVYLTLTVGKRFRYNCNAEFTFKYLKKAIKRIERTYPISLIPLFRVTRNYNP